MTGSARPPLNDETHDAETHADDVHGEATDSPDAAESAGGASSTVPHARPGGTARPPRRRSKVLLVVALIVVALAIAVTAFAITNSLGTPKPQGSAGPQPQASAGPSDDSKPTSAPPTDAPLSAFDASAPLQKNFDLFNRTAAATIAATANPVGADFTNALAAAGFDKTQMQITADRTTIDTVAPAIVFAVKVHDKCLLGQYTPSSREYDDQIVNPISTGSCLIGEVSAPQ